MTQVQLDGNKLMLQGAVCFATSRTVLKDALALLPATGSVQVDLSAVTDVDSSALAVLCELERTALKKSLNISFAGASQQLLSIADLSSAKELFFS
jgi:phospholipid transport system transporter-binding protein